MSLKAGTCRVGKWEAHVRINGAGQSGSRLIIHATKGEKFELDDIFTIAGVQDIEPNSHQPTGSRKRFIVIESMVAKGNGHDVLKFYPPIIGPNEPKHGYANVDTLPADNAILEWIA